MSKDDEEYYYLSNGKQKIYFKSAFIPHRFSSTALINLFISNGENRIFCSLKQELRPECGSDAMPAFTYSEYINGKTHTFWSNMHQIETIERSCR